MNELAELVGIPPEDLRSAGLKNAPEHSVDETHLAIDADQLETLANVVNAADSSLQNLEAKSLAFEADIKQLSGEMNVLQIQSESLHNRLAAREQALDSLQPLLTQFIIPASVVNEIFTGEIGPQFRASLTFVLEATQNKGNSSGKSEAGAARLRQVLITRAIERIKTFYVQKWRTLRRPGINAQAVQADLANNGELLRFLQKQTPRLAGGLERAYKNTMRWYYTMLFGKYGRWLGRQPLAVIDIVRPLGTVVSSSAAKGSAFTMGISAAKQLDAFNVGARPAALRVGTGSMPALALTAVPPVSNPYYPIELIVRSMLLALSDSFVSEATVSEAQNTSPFIEMFEPTLLFYEELLNKWTAVSSGDTFGLLLVVRLCQQSPLKRWIPEWLARVEERCWPRIVAACEAHAQSIEAASMKPSTAVGSREAAVGPHPMTQMVSAFISGLLQLSPDTPEPQLATAVRSIVEAYELFVSKLGAGNEQVLYNNYFIMAALLSDIDGPLASELADHFNLLVSAYTAKK